MARRVQSSESSLPSLYKYMRRRKIMSRAGYYLEIRSSGEVACTRNPASIYSEMLILSVGPNFVAIVGEEAKRYLAIDDRGRVFTAKEERKECVFREFLGRNFFTLIRTCYSDTHGRGWYLSTNLGGRVRAEKVPYSDEPQLHFIIKVVKKEEQKKKKEQVSMAVGNQAWKHRKRSSSSSSSGSKNSSHSSTASQSEYDSPLEFYSQSNYLSPISFSERPANSSPISFSGRSAFSRPHSSPERSQYGTPLNFMGNADCSTSSTVRSSYSSRVSSPGRLSHNTSSLSFPSRSEYGSPVSFSGQSEYGTPLSFMHEERVMRSPTLNRSRSGSEASTRSELSYSDPESSPALFGKTTSC